MHQNRAEDGRDDRGTVRSAEEQRRLRWEDNSYIQWKKDIKNI